MAKAIMSFVRSTKGAHVYEEVDSNGTPIEMRDAQCVIGNLYIRKEGSGYTNAPKLLTVTVEEKK